MEPNFDKLTSLIWGTKEENEEFARVVEEVKAEIKAQNPERFVLFEQFYALGQSHKQLSLSLQDRYGELEEDWMNIMDVCDRNGEGAYREIIKEGETFLARRADEVASLKKSIEEIGVERLRVYANMCLHEDNTSVATEVQSVIRGSGLDFVYLDKAYYSHIEALLSVFSDFDITAVDEWEKKRVIAKEKGGREQMRREKARILNQYQQARGRDLRILISICNKMKLVEGTPVNNIFLSKVSPEDLVKLEKYHHLLETKLTDYGIDLWRASPDDIATALDELFESGEEQ